MSDRETIKTDTVTKGMNTSDVLNEDESINSQEYKELYLTERNKAKRYFISSMTYIVILTILIVGLLGFILFISYRYSSTSVSVDSHIEKVDILDLRTYNQYQDQCKYKLVFTTVDGNEYNLDYDEELDYDSIKSLNRIKESWNKEGYYVIMDFDIITYTKYNMITNKVTTSKKIVINDAAAYLDTK